MRNVVLIIEYEGTNYVGWQTQPNGIAVQECIEKALKRITGEDIRINGSGRTDSGVHAIGQVANFHTQARMPADRYAFALNAHLPPDIRIRNSFETEHDFHARFSAKRKRYRYTILLSPHARALTRNTALHVHGRLDIESMEAVAKKIEGEHDFRAFMSQGTSMENTVRTVYESVWKRDGEYLHYEVEGSGFLYNMVRILVGTMLDIGKGILPPSAIEQALSTHQRSDAGATAPAHGLMLLEVTYMG